MENKSLLHFEVVSRAFTAVDIAQPLIVVPPETPVSYGIPSGPAGYPHNWCWLVADKECVYGYVSEETLFDEDAADTIGELAQPFGTRSLVPATMPLLDVIPRLAQESGWTLFLLSESGVTHYIGCEELDSMPIKLCLFALLAELEAEMRHALLSEPGRLRERWGYLPWFRQERLLKNSDHGMLPSEDQIAPERLQKALKWANLSDHERMLFADPAMLSRFGFDSEADAKQFFGRARQVRNVVAHGSPLSDAGDDLMVPQDFAAFVKDVQRVVAVFTEQRRAGQQDAEAKRN